MPSIAQAIGETYHDRNKLLSGVSRHLLLKGDDPDRDPHVIHPSEAIKSEWCPRSTYYRIIDAPTEPVPVNFAFEIAFGVGHDVHNKWQTWFWEMGDLRGMWQCLACDLYWYDRSPRACPRCDFGQDVIIYKEIPLENAELLIAGHADGDVLRADGDWLIIELKSIGTGTIRYDAPALLKRHTYKVKLGNKIEEVTNWRDLWNNIRRPFPPHLRQGMVYLYCLGRPRMVFIYEPKFVTAYPKEFEIGFQKDLIIDVLDECKTIKNSLESGKTPVRPRRYEDENAADCKKCPYRTHCWRL